MPVLQPGTLYPAQPFNVINPSGMDAGESIAAIGTQRKANLEAEVTMAEGSANRKTQQQEGDKNRQVSVQQAELDRKAQAEWQAQTLKMKQKEMDDETAYRHRTETMGRAQQELLDQREALRGQIDIMVAQGKADAATPFLAQLNALDAKARKNASNIVKLSMVDGALKGQFAVGGAFEKMVPDLLAHGDGDKHLGKAGRERIASALRNLPASLAAQTSPNAPPPPGAPPGPFDSAAYAPGSIGSSVMQKKEQVVEGVKEAGKMIGNIPHDLGYRGGPPPVQPSTPGTPSAPGPFSELADAFYQTTSVEPKNVGPPNPHDVDPVALKGLWESYFTQAHAGLTDEGQRTAAADTLSRIFKSDRVNSRLAGHLLWAAANGISPDATSIAKGASNERAMEITQAGGKLPLGEGTLPSSVQIMRAINQSVMKTMPDGKSPISLDHFKMADEIELATGESIHDTEQAIHDVFQSLYRAKDKVDLLTKMSTPGADVPKEIANISPVLREAVVKRLRDQLANTQADLANQDLYPDAPQNLTEAQRLDESLMGEKTSLTNQSQKAVTLAEISARSKGLEELKKINKEARQKQDEIASRPQSSWLGGGSPSDPLDSVAKKKAGIAKKDQMGPPAPSKPLRVVKKAEGPAEFAAHAKAFDESVSPDDYGKPGEPRYEMVLDISDLLRRGDIVSAKAKAKQWKIPLYMFGGHN